MPPPQKNWPPVARLSLSDQNGRTITISTEGTVPGRIGKNKRTAAVSQIASWELFWGDGTRNGDVGPPPLELEHTYDATLASAVIRLVVVDVNTLTATATMTISGLTTSPDAPQNLIATVLSASSIRLDWSDPSALSTSFNLERRLAGVGSFQLIASAITTTSYIDTGLTAATAYEYRVQGFNNVGGSAYSNTAAATTDPNVPPPTPPAAPSGLSATGSVFGQVTLAWTDNASDEAGFSIERALSGGSFSEIATVQANTITYVDLTVAASTAYQYRVRAFNAAGNSAYSNTASVTTAAPPIPAAPSNLVATPQTPTSVLLVWTDNANNEANFELERRIGTQAFARIITLAPNLTSYLDPTAQPSTIYQYRIRAINAAGTSAYSNIASATTPAVPPPDPPVVVLTPNAVSIPVGTATILSTVGTQAGAAPLVSWQLNWRDGSPAQAGSGPPPPSFTRTYAAAGTYVPDLRVTDANNVSVVAVSAPITVLPAPQPPNAPSQLTTALLVPASVQLNWVDNANNEQGTKIERRPSGGAFAQVAQVGANVTSAIDPSLTPNAGYDYRVRAFNADGNSGYSNTSSIFIPPSMPTFFSSWTTGNDTTGTGTLGNPWKTLNKGVQALGPGSQLLARGGNYDETLNPFQSTTIPSGTSWNAKVRIANYNGEVVTMKPTAGGTWRVLEFGNGQKYIEFDGVNLDGEFVQFDCVKVNAVNLATAAHHIRFQNLFAKGTLHSAVGPNTGSHVFVLTALATGLPGFNELINVSLSRNTGIGDGFSHGVYCQSDDNLMERLLIDGSSGWDGNGIQGFNGQTFNGPHRGTIRYTTIRNFSTAFRQRGITLGFGSTTFKAYHSLIYNLNGSANPPAGNPMGGVAIEGTGHELYNLTIYQCFQHGIYLYGPGSYTVRNCIAYANGTNFQQDAGTLQQSNNLFGIDPLFQNAAGGNFDLQLGSQAIDSGMTISTIPAVDIIGTVRPQAAAWDRGAYERVF